jgi:ketopantoate reductase
MVGTKNHHSQFTEEQQGGVEGVDMRIHFSGHSSTTAGRKSITLLVLATQAHQTVSVAAPLKKAAGQGVPILVVQNGVDQVERTETILRTGSMSSASSGSSHT